MDLSHLLCKNEPPNPSEIPGIQVSLADLLARQLELRLQLDEIDLKVEQHIFVLSPIRRVPLEILGNIFSLVVFGPLKKSSSRMMYPDTRESVVALCLVCQHWRRAALLTRTFWSQVSVDCPLNGVLSRDISYGKVGTWLSHQAVLPRVLEVGRKYFEDSCCDHDCDGVGCRYRDPSFGRLLAEGPALDKLILWLQDPECLQNLLDSFPTIDNGRRDGIGNSVESSPCNSFMQLNSLVLHFSDWISDPDSLVSHSSFAHLPPVKSFELYLPKMEETFENLGHDGGEEECDKAELNIPRKFLEGLKEFTYFSDWSLRHATGPLAHCIGLEKLVLDFTEQVSQYQQPLETTTPLANRLSYHYPPKPPHTSCLHTLDIELDYNGEAWVKLDKVKLWWSPLVNRINCLRTLCLRDMVFDEGVLTAMKIHELSSLTNLTLDSVTPLEELFGESGPFNNTPTTSGRRPFPSLQVFELLDLDSSFDLTLVFDFVENRRGNGTCATRARGRRAINSNQDSIGSIVARYYELDLGFVQKRDFYGRARTLARAGVAVKIGGPPKRSKNKKPLYDPLGVYDDYLA